MKRVILVLTVTFVGILFCLVEAYFGLLLYTWHSLANPMKLLQGRFQGMNLSFWVGLVLLVMTALQKRRIFVASPVTYCVALFLGIAYASLIVPMEMSAKRIMDTMNVITKIVLIAMVAPVLLTDLIRVRWFVATVAVSIGLLASYYGYIGLIAGHTNIVGNEGFGRNNEFANIVVGGLPYLFFSIARVKSKTLRLAGALVFIGNLAAIALALSRGAFLGVAVVLPLLIFRLRNKLLLFFLLFTVLPLLGAFASALYSIVNTSTDVISVEGSTTTSKISKVAREIFREIGTLERSSEDIKSAVSRMHFWRVAILMYQEHPFLGIGFDQYEIKYDRYDFLKGAFGNNCAVHNIFLKILSETGIFGILAFLSVCVSCFMVQFQTKSTARAIKDAEKKRELLDYVAAVRIATLGIFIDGLVLNCLMQEILWVAPSLTIALLGVARSIVRDEEEAALDEYGEADETLTLEQPR